MKRRSARPFVVEVKHTRSSRSSLNDAVEHNRAGPGLWHGLDVQGYVERPDSSQQPMVAVRSGDASKLGLEPVRRILPSLLPIFAPSEPEPAAERTKPASEKVSRVARKPRSEPVPHHEVLEVTPAVGIEALPAQYRPGAAVERVGDPMPRPTRLPVARTKQKSGDPALRPGERWKRRLPRVCW